MRSLRKILLAGTALVLVSAPALADPVSTTPDGSGVDASGGMTAGSGMESDAEPPMDGSPAGVAVPEETPDASKPMQDGMTTIAGMEERLAAKGYTDIEQVDTDSEDEIVFNATGPDGKDVSVTMDATTGAMMGEGEPR